MSTSTGPEIGSRWWWCGEHYIVVGHGLRDNEPGVRLQNINKRKDKGLFVLKLFERKAVRIED